MAKIEYKQTLIKAIKDSNYELAKMIIDTYGYDNYSDLLRYLNEGDIKLLKLLVEKGARLPDFEYSSGGQLRTLSMDNVNKILVTLIKEV